MVVVEIIFTKYNITPNEFVGICGTAGTIFWTSLLIILTYVGCPFEDGNCVEDYTGSFHLEHFPSFF
jgi:hypothetical protein